MKSKMKAHTMVDDVIHFQKITSSTIVWAFILDFISMLKIWRVFCAFKAMTLLAGFMIAESAEIGLLIGLVGSDMSMMTTCAVSPTFSRTQMYLSDSMVRELNPMFAGVIPTFVSWRCSWNLMGRICVIFHSFSRPTIH